MHQLGGSGGKENFTKIGCSGIAYEAISGPKMALNIPKSNNPLLEQDCIEAAHSLGMRHSTSRAIVHNAQFE